MRAPPRNAAKDVSLAYSPAEETFEDDQLDSCFAERHVWPKWQLASSTGEGDLAAGIPNNSPSISILPSAKRHAGSFECGPNKCTPECGTPVIAVEVEEMAQRGLTSSLQAMRMRRPVRVETGEDDGAVGSARFRTQMGFEAPLTRQSLAEPTATSGAAQESCNTSQGCSMDVLRLAQSAEKEALRELDLALLVMRESSTTSEPEASFITEPEPTCTFVRDSASWTTPSSLRPEPVRPQQTPQATSKQGEAETANILRASSMSVRRDRAVGIIDESIVEPEFLKEHQTPRPRKPPPHPTIYLDTTQVTAMEISCPGTSCSCW